MRRWYSLALLALLCAAPVFGVCKHENYIGDDDVAGWMHAYYASWVPGNAPLGGSENENFFIGRVRPLKRFTNEATQVIQDNAEQITRRKNRGLLWWCPIGESQWTSLPRYAFDSEAFSNWSYVTIHGNWTQGLLRQPGAFADVCHKNGVRTAVVSAAPWAQTLTSNDGGHGQNYQRLIDGGADKLLKLMAYYGIDGMGFNSEQTWNMRDGMKTLLQQCHAKKALYGMEDRLHFDFYNLNNQLSSGGSGEDFSDFFPSANGFFLNYNWGASILNSSQQNAAKKGGSSFDVYAGMDMQGRNAAEWTSLNNYDISIGIWGAHNKCMPYEGATEDGSTPKAIQNCYLRKCEQLFTGGTRNPVNDKIITDLLCNGTSAFFGVSKLMAAKSALSWKVNNYFPFISYMNLGNGEFFNNKGATTYGKEWYNIGMQDHLPTWRWWITTTYMGRTNAQVPSDTHASFTYEDAWFGGSCLKVSFDNTTISGSRYIQMYKTQFPINAGESYKLRVRYKVLNGSASMRYAMSVEGNENSEQQLLMGTMQANSAGSWQVYEKAVPAALSGKVIAQLGMKFTTIAAGTEILIGEVALVKDGVTYNPVKPTITDSKTQVFRTTSRGVDFKVIWECEKTAGEGGNGGTTPVEPETATRAANVSCHLTGAATRDNRYLTSFAVSGSAGASLSHTVDQLTTKQLYYDLRATKSLEVKRNEVISISPTWVGEWMMGYVYVDWNNDGDFADANEYVAKPVNIGTSGYINGNWGKPVDFTIPADAALGTYTIRYCVDWNSQKGNDNVDLGATSSCGHQTDDINCGTTAANGGVMIDFELHVTAGEGTINNSADAWKPVYNDEMDTWYFEIYAQQQGKDMQLVTTTTSWAAYAVEVPFDLTDAASKNVRVGVCAVAPDGTTKSEIAWSNYMDASAISIIEGFSVDKPVIKPNEEFTVGFDDVNHAPANYFRLLKPDGTQVARFDGVTSFTTQIAEKGLYDVEANYSVAATGVVTTEIFRAMVQVSGPEVGSLPEILTLEAANATQKLTSATGNVTFDLNYTGRPASGASSRALRLSEYGFGVKGSDLKDAGLQMGNSAFTIAFWFKPEQFLYGEQGTNFFNIRNPNDPYPASEWGYIWSGLGNEGQDFSLSVRKTINAGTACSTKGFNFRPGYWYHMAIVVDRNTSGARKVTTFINGTQYDGLDEKGNVVGWFNDIYPWSDANLINVGTTAHLRSAFDGYIDEYQIWNKALDVNTVRQAMWHFDVIPDGLIGYWDFENEPVNDHLVSTGKATDLKGYVCRNWKFADGNNDEGQSNLVSPTIGAGSPFLAGTFPITTTPSWKYTGAPSARGAVSGNDEAGSTSVSYNVEGEYTATLTLENPWGKDSRDIQLYVVDGTVGLDGAVVENLSVYPNPFVEELHIQFAKEGNYELEVLALDGRMVEAQSLNAAAGQVSRIAVNGDAGAYLVRVKMNGTIINTLKLIKK